jgi:hypothetical protein
MINRPVLLRVTKNDDLMIKISTGQSVAKRHELVHLPVPRKNITMGGFVNEKMLIFLLRCPL